MSACTLFNEQNKGPNLLNISTWSVLGKQNIKAKKVYYCPLIFRLGESHHLMVILSAKDRTTKVFNLLRWASCIAVLEDDSWPNFVNEAVWSPKEIVLNKSPQEPLAKWVRSRHLFSNLCADCMLVSLGMCLTKIREKQGWSSGEGIPMKWFHFRARV